MIKIVVGTGGQELILTLHTNPVKERILTHALESTLTHMYKCVCDRPQISCDYSGEREQSSLLEISMLSISKKCSNRNISEMNNEHHYLTTETHGEQTLKPCM